MGGIVKSYLIKKLLPKSKNLVSLEDHYQVIAKLLKAHTISGILDAGASHGRVAKRFLKYFPNSKVYAFEPNPAYQQTLRDCAASDPRFIPCFSALADQAGQADLQITSSLGSTSLLQPNRWFQTRFPEQTEIVDTVSVNVNTIDQWLAQQEGVTIELMKFDIQGGELKAFKGAEHALKHSVLLIYTEVWFNGSYEGGALFSEVDDYLKHCGFALYDLYKPKYDKHGMLMWGNAIYLHQQRLVYRS